MNLKNHFLIAMPSLTTPMFARSVIYLCEHSHDGAMGLIINRPIDDTTVIQLLNKLKIASTYITNRENPLLIQPIFNGGPLATEHGFILHSTRHGFLSSLTLTDELMLTTSLDILESIGSVQQPDNLIIALGCASWSAGQLEQEIIDNQWLVVDVDQDILFHTATPMRWSAAASKLGIDIYMMVNQVGHA